MNMRIPHDAGRDIFTVCVDEGTFVPQRDEQSREDVFIGDKHIGSVLYMRRRHTTGGSSYGWRRATASAESRLTSKTEAINDLVAERSRR